MSLLNRKKEFDYLGNFCEVEQIAGQSADYLYEALKNYEYASIDAYTEAMHQYENKADLKKHTLCNNLAHEFMPPIKREDITELSQELDNIVDSVEDVIRKIYMYNIHSLVVEINTLENAGDRLHAQSIRRLFLEEIGPSEQLVWTMIFESLKISIDACENATDQIEGIITKNT